jgi:hypothetical protein
MFLAMLVIALLLTCQGYGNCPLNVVPSTIEILQPHPAQPWKTEYG